MPLDDAGTLITDTARLTLYQGSTSGELLDLASNLWDDPGRREQCAETTERLARSVVEHAEQGNVPTHGA